MAKRSQQRRPTPRLRLPPLSFLDFIEWQRFTKDWNNLLLDDDALNTLQLAMISDPKAGAIVEGTGGLRKLRFSPPTWKTGKSGAIRVCYVYFEDQAFVFLLRAYAKNEKDNLTAAEKKVIHRFIQQIQTDMARTSMWKSDSSNKGD